MSTMYVYLHQPRQGKDVGCGGIVQKERNAAKLQKLAGRQGGRLFV